MQRLNEAAMESGQVPQETRLCPLRERYTTQRAQVRATRADECARFLQRAVLAWLYRPPDGPMVRRSQREVSALFADEGVEGCAGGGVGLSDTEHEGASCGVHRAAECVSVVTGTDESGSVPRV
jgi:hypothetical protein